MNIIIPSNKKAPEGANSKNGALNGLVSEPDNNIFNIFDTAECQAIFRRIEKLLAA